MVAVIILFYPKNKETTEINRRLQTVKPAVL